MQRVGNREMVNVSGEILINRPVEQVFDFVADQRNEPIYNPRILQSEKITDGPIGVGTRFRATVISGRRPVEMFIEVTEYQRARRFGSRTTMSAVDINGGLTFEPIAGATRMTWSWDLRPRGGPCGCSVRWSPALGGVKSKGSGPGSRTSWRDLARSAPQRSSDQDSWMIFAR
jgi:hypothetical protein